jgi:NitT/TauT family transport system ATP-binding protein
MLAETDKRKRRGDGNRKVTNMEIRIDNLSKSYGDKKVLSGFSAVLKEGECSVLMGPSGCGKTTLLRILMGLEQADGGTVTGVSDRIAAVFQENRLCEDFSPVTNVAMVLNRKIPEEIIRQHLSRIGLYDSLDQPVSPLSGGMKRRVAIVRALLADADLLLLDEPFKGLDVETKREVMDYFMEQSAGKTSLVVTHDPAEAANLSQNVLQF